MGKTLAVFGATGQQGSSVINNVLGDSELSLMYDIRALTRDANSTKAMQLKDRGIDVVACDMLERASVEAALTGVHFVFAMTTPSFTPDALQVERDTARLMADVAVAKGVEYVIFSTLPSVSDMSGGKYTHVTPFDAKAEAEKYIRGLPIKSAFCSLGFFMENLQAQTFLGPQPRPDGTWALARPTSGDLELPFLDAVGDAGKFVGAILASPEEFKGVTLCAAQGMYTWEGIAAAIAENTGKTVVFERITMKSFGETLPFAKELFMDGMKAQEEYGYFGPDTKKSVAWAAERARGRLTNLGEFLEAHPFQLA